MVAYWRTYWFWYWFSHFHPFIDRYVYLLSITNLCMSFHNNHFPCLRVLLTGSVHSEASKRVYQVTHLCGVTNLCVYTLLHDSFLHVCKHDRLWSRPHGFSGIRPILTHTHRFLFLFFGGNESNWIQTQLCPFSVKHDCCLCHFIDPKRVHTVW